MARRRGLSPGGAAAAAAGVVLCLTFYPVAAVAREPIWGAGADEASDTNFDKRGHAHPRKSWDAPRSSEGIRKRLAAGIGTTSLEQDVPGIAGDQNNSSTKSQDHAERETCKRREGWSDGGSTTGDYDVCRAGEGVIDPDTHEDAHRGRDREEIGQFAGAAEEGHTEASFVLDDDRLGMHDRPSTSREIIDSQTPRGLPPIVGVADTLNSQERKRAPEHDPWEAYQIITQADPVASWEILREARMSYYTFKFDRRQGRRQLGVLPTEMARLLPEAFSTFTLPVVLPNGSRSRVEGVPNIDWTYLFAHTVAVTQELKRRYDALDTKMDVLKAETQNASLKLVRFMEEQGKEWQPAASLRELAALSELKRDIVKNNVEFERATGRERRRWLERRHNQTLATAEMELDLATVLSEEKASLAVECLHEEEKGQDKLGTIEESLRMSTEVAVLLLDVEAAAQTARLSSNRRLSESLATLKTTKNAEREGEAAEVARIKARGAEARRQTQAVVDETFSLVGSMVLSAVSDPVQLVKIMATLLGVAFVGLLVVNSVSLAARAIRRRVTKPRLVRETDLPGSPPAALAAWMTRRGRAMVLPLLGKSRRCTGLDPMSAEALEGLVLPPNLEHRLRAIATSIRSAYSRGAPLPHVLIHGAPGSGKSVLARRLAKMCDLKTVVVAGGDVGSLGRSASSELSGLMRWAGGGGGGGGGGSGGRGGMRRRLAPGRRGKGVVVVMDEAEAALGDRRKNGMSENARSALNAVLLSTGELRAGFLMALTTSRPQDLDEAVLDRVDEVIELPKPGLAERTRLIRQYFSAYLHSDPPSDFLQSPTAVSAAASMGTTVEAGSSGRVPARTSHDDHSTSGRDTPRTKRAPPSLHPELEGEAEGCPLEEKTGKSEQGNGRRGGWACDGAGRMSEGFRDKSAGLMAMLAVRSEGFYGRDMAHFFSAVQAAVFASEDCKLTEGVWAATERQKLEEFRTKVAMTATATIAATNDTVTATTNTGSTRSRSTTNGCLEPSTFTTARIPAGAGGAKSEAGRGSTGQPGVSPLPSWATTAATNGGTKNTAPFHSSTLGRDEGGGSGASIPASPQDKAHMRERINGKGNHPAFATATKGVAAAAGNAPRNAATSEPAGTGEDAGSGVEEEVEAVRCRVSLSPPNDPENTHPERVTE